MTESTIDASAANNEDIERIVQGYEELGASPELRERVRVTMQTEQTPRASGGWSRLVKSCAGLVAGLLLITCVGVNVSPTLAYAMNDIPVLGSIVRVVTFNRYQLEDGGFTASVETPQIEGLLDRELEAQLNAEFRENAAAVIAAFEQDMRELLAEYDADQVHMGMECDYLVVTDNDDILAIDVYLLNVVGSSSTTHSFYTIDKHTQELLTLAGLFTAGADYVTPISEYIKGEMERRNQEEDAAYWVGDLVMDPSDEFQAIAPDQNFYINEVGDLVICFDKYEVAAGYVGSPEFVIPHSVVGDIWNR